MGNISDIYHIAQNKLQKALDFVENDSNALTVRGALYIHKKEFKHAIADLEKCVNKEIDAERQKNKNLALGWTNSDDVKQESTADTSNTSSKISDAKLYLISAFTEIYKLGKETEVNLTSHEILDKIKNLDPDNELVLSEREKREKDEKLQAELKLQKIKEQQKLMEAERMRNESVTALSRKREAVYKSILDTTSDFDTVEEKKRKKSLDSKMSDNLDKPLSKRNLGDILAAINHFDTGKSQKREIEKQEKEEGVKQETFG